VIAERGVVDLRQTGLNLSDLARRVQRIEDVLFSPALDALVPPARAREPGPWSARTDGRDSLELVTTRREQRP
jgi:hypothetical protein